jgi:antitoxin PrlF
VAVSTLRAKGRVTIPKEIRERLGLKEGDRLVFLVDERGNLLVRPERQSLLGRLPGLLSHLAKERPITREEMREAVKQRAAEKFKDLATRYPQEQAEEALQDLLSSRKDSR